MPNLEDLPKELLDHIFDFVVVLDSTTTHVDVDLSMNTEFPNVQHSDLRSFCSISRLALANKLLAAEYLEACTRSAVVRIKIVLSKSLNTTDTTEAVLALTAHFSVQRVVLTVSTLSAVWDSPNDPVQPILNCALEVLRSLEELQELKLDLSHLRLPDFFAFDCIYDGWLEQVTAELECMPGLNEYCTIVANTRATWASRNAWGNWPEDHETRVLYLEMTAWEKRHTGFERVIEEWRGRSLSYLNIMAQHLSATQAVKVRKADCARVQLISLAEHMPKWKAFLARTGGLQICRT